LRNLGDDAFDELSARAKADSGWVAFAVAVDKILADDILIAAAIKYAYFKEPLGEGEDVAEFAILDLYCFGGVGHSVVFPYMIILS
jgi:hypothetical protein